MRKDNVEGYGKEVILTGNVKYIGEGDDPAEDPAIKMYAQALKTLKLGEVGQILKEVDGDITWVNDEISNYDIPEENK